LIAGCRAPELVTADNGSDRYLLLDALSLMISMSCRLIPTNIESGIRNVQ
jgi:hypothetical protein